MTDSILPASLVFAAFMTIIIMSFAFTEYQLNSINSFINQSLINKTINNTNTTNIEHNKKNNVIIKTDDITIDTDFVVIINKV